MAAKTDSKKSEWFELPVGFYVPGVFAALTDGAIKRGLDRAAVIRDVLDWQSGVWFTCCGAKHACTVFSKEQIGEFHDLAVKLPYDEFRAEVARRYAAATMSCPTCGRVSRLRDRT